MSSFGNSMSPMPADGFLRIAWIPLPSLIAMSCRSCLQCPVSTLNLEGGSLDG